MIQICVVVKMTKYFLMIKQNNDTNVCCHEDDDVLFDDKNNDTNVCCHEDDDVKL